jgi:uncharacterized protein YhaN
MKLCAIDIQNFGIFTDRQFEFGHAPFQLIYGPNEAGKSTLLQLLRQVLFDFPVRSPYQFETHSGKMAAQALIDLADGRQVRFLRTKGNKDKVKGEILGTGESVNESALNLFLGNASAKLYEHVFGFSLNELASGEESLKHANLNEAMFGGSLGSPSNLQEIQSSLEIESGELFKGGAKVKVINALLRDIRARSTDIKDAVLKPRDFEDKEKALREAQEQVTTLSESREQAERQRVHLQRLGEAVSPWIERLSRKNSTRSPCRKVSRRRRGLSWSDCRMTGAGRQPRSMRPSKISPKQTSISAVCNWLRSSRKPNLRSELWKRKSAAFSRTQTRFHNCRAKAARSSPMSKRV